MVTGSDAPITVDVERFVAGGEALARDPEGRVVFVAGALPGESVQVTLGERHAGWSRGTPVRVVRSSPHRVVPPCPQRRDGCGGCDWQHLATDRQLEAKLSVVRDAFRRTGGIRDEVVERAVVPGGSVPMTGYRTTVRVIGDEAGRPSFRAERSDRRVPAHGCAVSHPGLLALLDEVRLPDGLEATLRVSSSTGERTAHVVVPERRADRPVAPTTGERAIDVPADVGVGPDASLSETVDGHAFRVSAASFFQSGPAAAALLVRTVVELAPELADARRVVDAYAGVGLFAVAAVPVEAHVTVVETSATACADATFNLRDRPATVVRSRVDRWVRNETRASGGPTTRRRGASARRRSVDVVIADPARSGLGRAGAAAIAALSAPTVILVSCDPVAGARDVALLEAAGYRFEAARVLDVFPQTHHVEVVTRFTRRDQEHRP